MDLNKCMNLMKAFSTSQFSCCPLIWMLHNCNLNNKVNQIYERVLKLVEQNNLGFSELLGQENSVTVHRKLCKYLRQKSIKLKME